MQKRKINIILCLFILFFLDIIKPFHYALSVEFLFIGVVFLFLYLPCLFSLIASLGFAYLKDILSFRNVPFSLIEFVFLFIIIRYIVEHLRLRQKNSIVFFVALFSHIALNSIYEAAFLPLVAGIFFVHSAVCFLLTDFLITRYRKGRAL